MKKPSYPVITAVAGLIIASLSPAWAGGSAPCCGVSCCYDGIAASPKTQATLGERCRNKCTAPAQVQVTTITPQAAVAASPKVQQMLGERTAASTVQSTETAGYQPTGSDGITASPKVRAMLNEHSVPIQIAPVK